MTKIPIITQNFSSPDGFNDAPLMLLPQASTSILSDKDQEGFSQLLLHDLHRHRQSYVRSYTAFETLKKRQDFILRQENLRALQNFEQRMVTKQEQYIDQSFHAYEQCFVKVLNGNSSTNRNEQLKRPQTAAPSFDKFHNHNLSHGAGASHDQSTIVPFHRYQKTHRPPVASKYRSNPSVYHSAQSFHDAFQSSSFSTQSQPFVSFTEGYLQKYGDRTSNKTLWKTGNDGMEDIRERNEDDKENEEMQSTTAEPNPKISHNKKPIPKSKTPDLQHYRTHLSSRNTNTPSSTPQIGLHDALRDGLTMVKDDDDHGNRITVPHEKRRSSQQSTSQTSNMDPRISIKRPKTAKKKSTNGDGISSKKTEVLTTKTTDDDLLKQAMIVQNYASTTIDQNLSSNNERLHLPTTTNNIDLQKISLEIRRPSLKSSDDNVQITPKAAPPTPVEEPEPTQEQKPVETSKEPVVEPVTNNVVIENKQPVKDKVTEQKPVLEIVDTRKRVKKGAFDPGESMSDMIAFELGMMGGSRSAMKRPKSRLEREGNQNEDEQVVPENQATLDLLEKIRQSSNNSAVNEILASLQGCRFELPYDLKLLETLTPLEYLSKYCRLSSRRNYQFKRVFDKYRNSQYRFESNNLYTSITEIHRDHFTRSQYDTLCQLVDIGSEQHQFTYDTYSGILALCERMLCNSKTFRTQADDNELAKDILEKCDFDSLDRKLDGLNITEQMKNLLKAL